jgi:[ribosomal protein S5]-alanine N-acetyltransferase
MNLPIKTTGFPDMLDTLDTLRLRLRPLTLEDADFIFQHFSNPQVAQTLLDEEPLTSREQAVEIIEFYQNPADTNYNRWGIVHKTDGVLVGTCGFHKWDTRRHHAEIGYDLSPSYWGKGLMVEALRPALNYGFERLALNRVEALVYVHNPQSVRVLEKLGFKCEGVLREYFYLNGQYYDHAIYSLLRHEWCEK